ncbi:MAG: CDP-diacylglycerol--glycerol-3-phosphate 3-phosphatidyltransferase [Candidatus Aminicenantes bacterium RBG_13_62_12]|nr:MAG: CDP-diacylglycerol--glycerol-3-phosphate 3-phosphatidyltransferase [Candidatus Aminicenantes bacterium RBG_13_62_12]
MNLANILTSFRILIIPFLVIIMFSDLRGREIVAASLFAAAWLTDWLDGLWARKNHKVSTLGQLLDPTADKLLVVSVLVCLVELGAVPAWMAVIIIGRELAVSGFRAIAASRNVAIPASMMGKIKMAVESATLTLLLLGEKNLGALYPAARVGLWLAVAISLFSGLEYYLKYLPRLSSQEKTSSLPPGPQAGRGGS